MSWKLAAPPAAAAAPILVRSQHVITSLQLMCMYALLGFALFFSCYHLDLQLPCKPTVLHVFLIFFVNTIVVEFRRCFPIFLPPASRS